LIPNTLILQNTIPYDQQQSAYCIIWVKYTLKFHIWEQKDFIDPRTPAECDEGVCYAGRYDCFHQRRKKGMVVRAIELMTGRFTISGLRRTCPGVSNPTLQA